ncbi:MAG: Na+/H+ antiporter NhaC family protein, partial [Oscillospiraceae bacterium]
MFYWIISLGLIMYSAVKKIYIGYTLTVVLLIFCGVCLKNGKTYADLKLYFDDGIKKGLIVSKMLIFIAINTSMWMASGCIATLLFYSTKVIIPSLFLPICFLICGAFSLLLGSAFATAATIGVIVYIIGCAGGANPAMVAGAVISGIYVGDRASPISSSLVLLATVNEVEHSDAVAMSIKTMVAPIVITALAFAPFSLANPISITGLSQFETLKASFNISVIAVLPAVALLVACAFKAKIKSCLIISIAVAIPIAMFSQGLNVMDIVIYALKGFVLPEADPLYKIVRGGGLIPMMKTIYILLVSCSLAAVIQMGGVLSPKIETYLSAPTKRVAIYIKSCVVGLLTTAIGSNQTVSIVMTSQLMENSYKNSGFSNMHRTQDISFASVLLSVIPPWSLTVV